MSAPRRLRARCRALLQRFSADQSGIAAVEFALGATMLFGLTLGIVDVGRYMFTVNGIEHGTKEGARYAAIHAPMSVTNPKTATQIKTFVVDSAVGMNLALADVNLTWEDPVNTAAGTSVTVAVTKPFNFIYQGIFPSASISLTAQSTYTVGR